MEQKQDDRQKARLARLLQDFPWLWAIKQSWGYAKVTIKVRYTLQGDYLINVSPVCSPNKYRLWFKIKRSLSSVEFDEIVKYEPTRFGVLATVIDDFKEFHRPSSKIEYVILVSKEDKGEAILILRPPKSQKFF